MQQGKAPRKTQGTAPSQRPNAYRSAPLIIDTSQMRAISTGKSAMPARPLKPRAAPQQAAPDPSVSRRDFLMKMGGATAAITGGLFWLSRTKSPHHALDLLTGPGTKSPATVGATTDPTQAPQPTATHVPSKWPFGYFHGCFTLNSPDDVPRAAAMGINYTFTYGDNSRFACDAGSPMGKALAQHGMKTFLDLQNTFLTCSGGVGQINNEDRIRELVAQYMNSPVLAGYWTKDDDCGDEAGAVERLHTIIRSVDPNPNHWLMPGYGSAYSMRRNYQHGQANILAFYPYPAYGPGPASEVPQMLQIMRDRTPAGATPPPFLGIYQAFGTPPNRPTPSPDGVLAQAQAYVANGAIGLAAFGWAADDQTQIINNTESLQQGVQSVTTWLGQNGYGAP